MISSRNEAMISFGSNRIYVEKYIENPRHIEVQILADDPKVIQLGERECSIQRRHQKLIEESPSTALTKEMRNNLTETAIAIMKEIHYQNAGTGRIPIQGRKVLLHGSQCENTSGTPRNRSGYRSGYSRTAARI